MCVRAAAVRERGGLRLSLDGLGNDKRKTSEEHSRDREGAKRQPQTLEESPLPYGRGSDGILGGQVIQRSQQSQCARGAVN